MQRRADVVLVIDASSSMLEHTLAGRTKLAAAIEAAQMFVDTLNLDFGDQAALVAFNSDAWLLAPLTSNQALLDAGFADIQVAQFTRIDRGIALASQELHGPHHTPQNVAVMIVLTDGLANPVPVDAAVAEAQRAKDASVVVFTVGLGQDLDFEALEQMASQPSYFYAAPDAEDLARIYRDIAGTIPCPHTAFWGRRP
jgi:Mg-chelatase subunit ChlD